MTWRSAINEMPECDEDHPHYPVGYDGWLEKVTTEPWFRALQGMVKWTGTWIGTEERFFEELEMRAGREAFASPDFPSTFERLRLYSEIARDGFSMEGLGFWHHRELTEEDLDHYDAPGWGPEAPILVYRGRAADRPNYWQAMCRLLAHGEALPLAVLTFTGEDGHFRRSRRWTGTTVELAEKLRYHDPNGLGRVPIFFANCFRPTEEHGRVPSFPLDPPDLLEPSRREDYLAFYRHMTRWAPVLRKLKIGVDWEKRPYARPATEGAGLVRGSRLYWTIEAPRWKKRDLFSNPSVARDLPIMVMAWMAGTD